ncbi:MAG: hypothetical protein KAH21_00880 [Spirochaetaceae bacterium]|nr:hypothetical protein [Spirochaetaceae bacterium]
MESVHFYVSLKDDFTERCQENELQTLFDDLDNPYQDASSRLTPGKVYPVMNVGDDGRRLTVIDDLGRLWTAVTGLFKYAEN